MRQYERALDELRQLVSIPSVSTRAQSLPECAQSVSTLLSEAGFTTRIVPGQVAPFVIGEIGSGDHTVIIYNHYDVQPEDPNELWKSLPFELTERNGHLFGRGVADDKGEFISRLAGWRKFRETNSGELPYRLIWIVDGEEEIGSPGLEQFVKKQFPDTHADFCWWEFGEIDSQDRPVILLGFKGLLAVELTAETCDVDLHSSLGIIFENPLWRLTAALNSLRDDCGNVLIDGFYDDVEQPSEAELAKAASPPYSIENLRSATGGRQTLTSVNESSFYTAMNFAPCININGISGGYTEDGHKTVLPAKSDAKLDFRLVPHQRPKTVAKQLRSHLDNHGFQDVSVKVVDDVVIPVRSDPGHWAVECAAGILEKHFGKPAILQPSSPASGTAHPFVMDLGAEIIGIGLTHHGAALHSPNENIKCDHLKKMINVSADFFAALAANYRSVT